MTELDINQTTHTDMTGVVKDYSVSAKPLDVAENKETFYDFPKAAEYMGYYKTIPELKKAIDALVSWTVGKGYEAKILSKSKVDRIAGWGKDSFQTILENMLILKKVMGDSFAEIIVNDKGDFINLKPISAEKMRIVVDSKGMIKRYEEHIVNKEYKKYEPSEILHLSNDRVGGEIHGTSVIEACKWVIDARNEAMTDYRKVLHRNVVPLRRIEVDSENTAKINTLKSQYAQAINKGEVLVIPKGTVEIKDAQISIQDPITWIQYLENFFYQAVGIPKIILGGSEQFTEASSKVGYLTFEQVYAAEQRKLEEDLKRQLGLNIEFVRPVSLKDNIQEEQTRNIAQTGFQPNDVEAGVGK